MTDFLDGKMTPIYPPIETGVSIAQEKGRIGRPLDESAECTTGLNLTKDKDGKFAKINFQDPNKVIIPFLNELDFGPVLPLPPIAQEPWDCEDKAFWAAAHARKSFPGLPIGIAESSFKGLDHAINIIWFEKTDKSIDYFYYDPSALDKEDRIIRDAEKIKKVDDGLYRITAFPVAKKGQAEKIHPIDSIKKSFYGCSIAMDLTVAIYPSRAPGNKGVLDYLEGNMQDKFCVNKNKHPILNRDFNNLTTIFGTHSDDPLWNMAHVRRCYPGFPIAVAIGKPKGGISMAVNLLWFRVGDKKEGDIKRVIWDQKMNNGKGGIVSDFQIEATFM
jgi:hypothetical protein